jgi:hypothetical protein
LTFSSIARINLPDNDHLPVSEDEARRERWASAPVELFDPAVPGAFQTREPKIDREISDVYVPRCLFVLSPVFRTSNWLDQMAWSCSEIFVRSHLLAILSVVAIMFVVGSGIYYLRESVHVPMQTRIFAGLPHTS